MDKSCINNSSFNPNSNFSVDAKINFEKIFLKSFDEIMRDDIFNIQKLTIDEKFNSYEGLEYFNLPTYQTQDKVLIFGEETIGFCQT